MLQKEEESQRSSDAEILRRVGMCVELLIAGWNAIDIFRFNSKQQKLKDQGLSHDSDYLWGVTSRQIDNYVRKAYEIIGNQEKPKIKEAYGQALIRWNALYRKAVDSKDYGSARLIQKEIDKLQRIEEHEPDDKPGQNDDEKTEFLLPGGIKIKI